VKEEGKTILECLKGNKSVSPNGQLIRRKEGDRKKGMKTKKERMPRGIKMNDQRDFKISRNEEEGEGKVK